PPSPDRAWNTALPAAQSWISDLAKQAEACSSFNELLDTPIDFSNFIMHRLNLDTYRTNLRRREAYTAYSNPRGFIYQNKDKKNRLMRIDELHKFSDVTLNDVHNALDNRLKGIRMQYLPSIIWRKGDKDRAA
nr:hypothetical protein [Tanacetum cinerariifolium]